MFNHKLSYVLADNVRIFSNGADELRIRKGIWNFEEATLSLQGFGENLKAMVVRLLNALDEGEIIDIEREIDQVQLLEDEKNHILSLFGTLQAQNYLHLETDNTLKLFLHNVIGGTVMGQFIADNVTQLKPVLFFADTDFTKEYIQMIAKHIGLPVSVMSAKEFNDLATADLTTKFDGYETNRQMEEFTKLLTPYCCVVGSMERPHINFLRNLNRLLIRLSKPLCLSLLDGPFMSLFTIKPPETGCFECYENRLLARMEDMSAYRNFVAHTRKSASGKEKTLASPLIQSLTSVALFEGFLISAIGRAKLAGRVLNVYIPILEIQVQDLLRVPFCPACGFIAEAQMEEMYTSSKKIINKLVDKVILKSS